VAGGLVFKPGGGPVYEWLAHALDTVVSTEIRIATPVRARDGSWECSGWTATRWVEGANPDRSVILTWMEIICAGRAFHRAVAHMERPDCLDTRQDWWALADRAAWGEQPPHFAPGFAEVAGRLQEVVAPLGRPQIVHGDLTGNVLFSHKLAPAVIDISPYWRSPEYAEGVVLADALCWHDAPGSVLERAGVSVAAVARALLFRMATTSESLASRGPGIDLCDEARRYGLAAAAIGL
jgi:uncharacterized protein (TIGR02569 family)